MKTASEARAILQKLERQHPAADTELHYENPYQLLVATILSAQTTDERVNQVTPALFARYSDAASLARATRDELEGLIKSTGFFRQKAQSLIGMAQALVASHGGVVPASMDALVELPGVGRKTANVVLGHALGVPGLAVDRHVLRVSNRIGLADSEEPEVVEQQLTALYPADTWRLVSDTLILHGRRICKPRPLCDRCAVRNQCDFYQGAQGAALGPATRRAASPTAARAAARTRARAVVAPGGRAASATPSKSAKTPKPAKAAKTARKRSR